MSEGEAKPAEQSASENEPSRASNGPSVPPGSERGSVSPAEAAAPEDALRADLDKAQAEAVKLKDQLLRTAADFDNYRKRARKDVEDAQRKGLERALLELLPVSDNLERAVQASQGATDVNSILEGVRMVLRFFEDALARLGVERVESLGQAFDPGLHEAVQHIESDQNPGTVVLEMTPGYRLNGKLLRAAMVAVARPKVPASPESAPPSNGGSGSSMPEPPVN